MAKMPSEKKVVVPMNIHRICPKMNQEKKALISSVLNGRALRIENHLKWTLNRDQKPVAAANSSCLDGAWR